jgi:predicted O-methyltransferase YrrM
MRTAFGFHGNKTRRGQLRRSADNHQDRASKQDRTVFEEEHLRRPFAYSASEGKMADDVSYRKIKSISGWLGRTDFEIFKQLLNGQQSSNRLGSIAEIGVHHGKSFVPMAAYSGNSKLYAIDIFENQEKNIDNSGSGDKEKFLQNLRRFSIDESRVVIDARLSSDVSASDIKNSVGLIKFFHIDGGHHFDAIVNDLELAAQSLTDDGIIVVDDMFRPEWPEVSIGAFSSDVLSRNEFVCFAIGFNKSYFCRSAYVNNYQDILKRSQFLNAFLTKEYKPSDRLILIYQRYPLPEWNFGKLILWWLSIYSPDIYVSVNRSLGALRKRATGLTRPKLQT